MMEQYSKTLPTQFIQTGWTYHHNLNETLLLAITLTFKNLQTMLWFRHECLFLCQLKVGLNIKMKREGDAAKMGKSKPFWIHKLIGAFQPCYFQVEPFICKLHIYGDMTIYILKQKQPNLSLVDVIWHKDADMNQSFLITRIEKRLLVLLVIGLKILWQEMSHRDLRSIKRL